MKPVYLYEVLVPGDPARKFETLREGMVAFHESVRTSGRNVTIRRLHPKNKRAILETMLAEKGLGHLKVWYRPKHQMGWMIDEEYEGEYMQRLGYCFTQAVDMLRGNTVDFMYGAKERP